MTAVVLLVRVAKILGSSITGVGSDAVREYLLADEGGHCFLVVLKTGSGIVGSAGTAVSEGIRRAGVVCVITAAESTAGVCFGFAPLGSQSQGDRARINGGICRLSENTGREGEERNGSSEHVENWQLGRV